MIAASISLHVSISDKTGMFMRPMCPGAGRSTGRTGEDKLGGGGRLGGAQRSWVPRKQAAHAKSEVRLCLRSSFQAETLNRNGSEVLETLVSRSII